MDDLLGVVDELAHPLGGLAYNRSALTRANLPERPLLAYEDADEPGDGSGAGGSGAGGSGAGGSGAGGSGAGVSAAEQAMEDAVEQDAPPATRLDAAQPHRSTHSHSHSHTRKRNGSGHSVALPLWIDLDQESPPTPRANPRTPPNPPTALPPVPPVPSHRHTRKRCPTRRRRNWWAAASSELSRWTVRWVGVWVWVGLGVGVGVRRVLLPLPKGPAWPLHGRASLRSLARWGS